MQIRQEKGCYTLYKENEAIGTAVVDGTTILRLEVVPRWRGRGYGSYLLKEILRQNGGLDPKQATRFTAPLPRDAAGRALAQKYGFAPDGSQLVRRRVPDLSAVQRFQDPLPDVCVGAVTSVRVTPLEKVRLLRMAEKSLDMLR